MLAEVTIQNTEETVYTVPSGKTAMISLEIYPTTSYIPITVKINTRVLFSGTILNLTTFKLVLNSGDSIKVSTTSTVNAFVHGLEV